MLLKWNDFLLESLLLESALNYSDKFQGVLDLIPDTNPIKSALINLKTKSTDIPSLVQNFIDITDNKEEISFIQDRRAQTIIKESPERWVTNSSLPGGKYLSFNKDVNGEFNNKNVFELLGFTPQEPVDQNHPIPNSGVYGEILSEVVGPKTGRTFVLFKWNDGSEDRLICLNKDALELKSDAMDKVFTTSRNNMRIGRLVGSILRSANITATNTDIENFVNDYKSAWGEYHDEFKMFDIVSGYKITHWYDSNNYEEISSTLGNSCMGHEECQNYFGIYVDNSDKVKLVILYSEKAGGMDQISQAKKRLIKGRALLWKTDQGDMFLDRIYTINDGDVNLFKRFADKNGWWSKKTQNSYTHFVAENDGASKEPDYTVTLRYTDHEYYPYVDTLPFLQKNYDGTGILSNKPDMITTNYELRDTEGYAEPFY